MKRLGWTYLRPEQVSALRGVHGRPVLDDRLLPALQRFSHPWRGRQLRLSDAAVRQILAQANSFHATELRSVSNAGALALILGGVESHIDLPDGTRVPVTVPLVDWQHPHRNHWDVADDLMRSGTSRDPGIRDLIGYVNGLPLVLVACVERDMRGRWGTVDQGVRHLMCLTGNHRGDPAPDHVQLLLSLDRAGGLYGGFSSPAHAWTRWREHGECDDAWQQLRAVRVRDFNGPADGPLATHAELLNGLLQPGRLLEYLLGYCSDGGPPPWRIARAAQFFACSRAIHHLRQVARTGLRNDGQVCLAPGTGMAHARAWLLLAIARDAELARLRILMPVETVMPSLARTARTIKAVHLHLEQAAPPPLQLGLKTLHGWARQAGADLEPERGLVLLVDASFWDQPADRLAQLRSRLPGSSWLTLSAAPVDVDGPCGPGPVLYHYRHEHAVADRVAVPVWYDAVPVPGMADTDAHVAQVVTRIQRHVQRAVRLTRHDLRAELLVASDDSARRYQQAFQREGQLHTVLRGRDAAGPARVSVASADLVISSMPAPHTTDPRLAVLYLDDPLQGVALARWLGTLNQRAPDKPHALLVDFTGNGLRSASPLGPDLLPPALPDCRHTLAPLKRRLRGTLPVPADLAACREGLAPHWVLNAYGEDRDLHQRSRWLFGRRVTRLGQVLQVAMSACGTADDAQGTDVLEAEHAELQRCCRLRDVVYRDAREEDSFTRDDLQVRQWVHDAAFAVREPASSYEVPGLTDDGADSPLCRANRLYSQLLHRLEDPADEPDLQAIARGALRRLLADHPAAEARLTALDAFASRIPALLGSSMSRGALLVKGIVGHRLRDQRLAALGRQVDTVVAAARFLLPDRADQFHLQVRLHLQPLFEKEVGEETAHLVLDAILARAPHWEASG